jgi:hypothetical protein
MTGGKDISAGSEQPRGMEPILNSLMQATLDVTTTSRPALRKRFEEILRGQVRDAAQPTPDRELLTEVRTNLADNITLFSHHKAALLRLVDNALAAQPPAAPVETYIYGGDGRSDAVETDAGLPTYQDVRGILPRSSAGNSEPAEVEEDDPDVLTAARAIAEHGFGRPWDDFHVSNAFDTDQNDLIEYGRAAVSALRSRALPQEVAESYRETVQKVSAAREKGYAAARANLQEAWAAMALIREAVETLGPVGAVPSAEHLDGPTFMHEAEAIVNGIQALAHSRPQHLSPSASSPAEAAPSQRLPE